MRADPKVFQIAEDVVPCRPAIFNQFIAFFGTIRDDAMSFDILGAEGEGHPTRPVMFTVTGCPPAAMVWLNPWAKLGGAPCRIMFRHDGAISRRS